MLYVFFTCVRRIGAAPRSNAEEKSIFFLLSLRSSANLCVSALILPRLRANPDIAVQRTQGSELGKEMAFTGQVVAPLCPTTWSSLGSMHCNSRDCWQAARKFARGEGLREDMKRQED